MSDSESPPPGTGFEEIDAGAGADGHVAAEGMDPGGVQERQPFWYRALRSTSPNPPISEVGSLQDVRDHWQRYGLRGLQKAAGADDTEAWVDLIKFVVGFALENRDAQEDTSASENDGISNAEAELIEASMGDGFTE